jgi:hypothetical protein
LEAFILNTIIIARFISVDITDEIDGFEGNDVG